VDIPLPHGYRLLQLEETTSTNTAALDAARAGEASGLWISARRQTGGRGSRGRHWVSIEGNLLASLLLIDPGPAARLPELTFVTALSVRDAIAAHAQAARVDVPVTLKWPNDILVAGRKASGILLESHALASGRAVIIGIGVNCVGHPQDTLHPATNLGQEGITATADALLSAIAANIGRRLAAWREGEPFSTIRQEWLSHAQGVGERIRVKLPDREFSGIFEDFAEDGQLVMRLDDRATVRLSAADIFFANQIRNGA
jgi:BirA family transcriptional regulator, biotin operon repressor / biotin---[acetyl-CoA-carboxylase] ligase